jgi:hypothetical protein
MQTQHIVLFWFLQVLISSIINLSIPTRIPKNIFDFLMLTFLPYVIYCLLFNKSLLTED